MKFNSWLAFKDNIPQQPCSELFDCILNLKDIPRDGIYTLIFSTSCGGTYRILIIKLIRFPHVLITSPTYILNDMNEEAKQKNYLISSTSQVIINNNTDRYTFRDLRRLTSKLLKIAKSSFSTQNVLKRQSLTPRGLPTTTYNL